MRVFTSSSGPPPACDAERLHALVEQQVAVMRIVLPVAGIQTVRNATDPATGRKEGVIIRVRVSDSQFSSACTTLAGIYERAQARRWTKTSAWFRIGAVGPLGQSGCPALEIQLSAIESRQDRTGQDSKDPLGPQSDQERKGRLRPAKRG